MALRAAREARRDDRAPRARWPNCSTAMIGDVPGVHHADGARRRRQAHLLEVPAARRPRRRSRAAPTRFGQKLKDARRRSAPRVTSRSRRSSARCFATQRRSARAAGRYRASIAGRSRSIYDIRTIPRAPPRGSRRVLVLPWNERYTAEHVEYIARADRGRRAASSPGRRHETERNRARFALVGVGRDRPQPTSKRSRKSTSASLDAVVDPRRAAAEAVAEQKTVRWFETRRTASSSSADVDAVIICTPPYMHYEIVRALLGERQARALREAAHDHVARTREELIATADANGLVLTMASKFRYVDDIIKAKAILESGILGESSSTRTPSAAKAMMKDRWNAVARRWPAGACSSTTARTPSTSPATSSGPSRRCRRRTALRPRRSRSKTRRACNFAPGPGSSA